MFKICHRWNNFIEILKWSNLNFIIGVHCRVRSNPFIVQISLFGKLQECQKFLCEIRSTTLTKRRLISLGRNILKLLIAERPGRLECIQTLSTFQRGSSRLKSGWDLRAKFTDSDRHRIFTWKPLITASDIWRMFQSYDHYFGWASYSLDFIIRRILNRIQKFHGPQTPAYSLSIEYHSVFDLELPSAEPRTGCIATVKWD